MSGTSFDTCRWIGPREQAMPIRHLINHRWIDAAGPEGPPELIDQAALAARKAFESWSNTTIEDRIALFNRFAEQIKKNRSSLAKSISDETGKPNWESLTEIDSMVGKVAVSIEAFNERRK